MSVLFTVWGYGVTVIEFASVILAFIAVALGIRGTRWAWPFYFVSSLLYGWLFLAFDLPASAAMQLIFMTAAIWGPVGVPAARNVFAYCFEQLECNRITLHCKVSNARALKMVRRLGFKDEGLCRAYFDGEDAIVLGLLRAEQRII